MKRPNFFVIGSAVIIGAAVLTCIVVNRPKDVDEHRSEADSLVAVTRFLADSPESIALRESIEANGLVFTDDRGITAVLAREYARTSPLIEIIPKMRDLDGLVRPFKVEDLYIVAEPPEHGLGSCRTDGFGLVLQIGPDGYPNLRLEYDSELSYFS
jgi:hypothetical protein